MHQLSHVLVADDNSDDLFLLRQAFRRAGASSTLHAVADGVEAIAYLEGTGAFHDRTLHPLPELILLDINMPRMNGFEVLQWARRDPRFDLLVIHMLTASARDADARRAYELHANSYVIKPTRIDELVAFVRALHEWHRFAAPTPSLTASPAIASSSRPSIATPSLHE